METKLDSLERQAKQSGGGIGNAMFLDEVQPEDAVTGSNPVLTTECCSLEKGIEFNES